MQISADEDWHSLPFQLVAAVILIGQSSMKSIVVSPGPSVDTVVNAAGIVQPVPAAWSLLQPGDAAWTRRVKAAGDHWVMQEQKGRRTFSRGVWAPAETIERIRADLEAERATEGYAKRRAADSRRREKQQQEYVDEFQRAVVEFLDFNADYESLACRLARAVANHATPVGSGTVARTKRISVERRAEAAVIAWMRHQTTGYDNMKIERRKGRRREVRRWRRDCLRFPVFRECFSGSIS